MSGEKRKARPSCLILIYSSPADHLKSDPFAPLMLIYPTMRYCLKLIYHTPWQSLILIYPPMWYWLKLIYPPMWYSLMMIYHDNFAATTMVLNYTSISSIASIVATALGTLVCSLSCCLSSPPLLRSSPTNAASSKLPLVHRL